MSEEERAAIGKHHADVDQFKLAALVPDEVKVKFETAKNLYLYAWFVYRFYPVSEHHALTCLELGLRMRFPDPLPKKYWNKPPSRKPTLHPLLRFASESGFLQNKGFRRWHKHVEQHARQRYVNDILKEMTERNLDQVELNYEQAIPNEQDQNWNLLSVLLEVLPEIRNSYAHGSTMLHDRVLGTLELVSEILNQLFDPISDKTTL
ncbi:MAG: hypothetical protein WCK63_07535 [Betaproteobacteria bacterium]